jgi:hypothetical protein
MACDGLLHSKARVVETERRGRREDHRAKRSVLRSVLAGGLERDKSDIDQHSSTSTENLNVLNIEVWARTALRPTTNISRSKSTNMALKTQYVQNLLIQCNEMRKSLIGFRTSYYTYWLTEIFIPSIYAPKLRSPHVIILQRPGTISASAAS